ncbi:hypothetical protein KIPB_017060, partial [Kipferlia bialata]
TLPTVEATIWRMMMDSVWSVRRAPVDATVELTKIVGTDWCDNTVVPRVLGLRTEKSYLLRSTLLDFVAALAPHMSQDTLGKRCVPCCIGYSCLWE